MGISTRFVVLYGIHHEWNEEWHEALEEYYENTKQPEDEDTFKFYSRWAVMDYMSGEGFYVGKVLDYSPDMRWDSPEMNSVIDTDKLPSIHYEHRLMFAMEFPKFSHLLDGKWKIHAFTDFS